MAGSSKEHNLITSNIIVFLGSQLKKRNCRVYPQDMRVHVPSTGLFTYPGIAVVCGTPQFLTDANLDTLTDPIPIVEVLSDSTEGYDKGAKFDNYRSLESLREYVLIAQNSKKVIRYTKQADGSWILMDFIDDATEVELASIECSITEAVNLAAKAWDGNSNLRKLFGSAKPDKGHPLPITDENVGQLLKKINQERHIISKAMPRDSHGNFALAH